MGTAALQSLNSLMPNLFAANRGQKPDPFGLGPLFRNLTTPAAEKPEVGLEYNSEQDVEDAYDATVYHSQVKELTLAAQFQQVAARIAELNGEDSAAAETQAQQLTFDFQATSRYEELIKFAQRTQAVAEGLDGAQQATYLEASQSVAARFDFSMSISGSALIGFTDASEGLQNDSDAMDQFLGLTKWFLDAADDMFNDFLSIFGGLSVDDPTETFKTLIQQFLQQLTGFFGEAETNQGNSGTGSTTTVSFQFQMEFSFTFTGQITNITIDPSVIQQSDPIIFDLDGDGFEMTGFADGANFDILGNGNKVRTAFVTGGDAFLAIDRNGDGQINSGRELFGDQNGAANGYEELRKMDSNGDGVINRFDKDFDKLVLFRDNGNGITEEGELISLADSGIAEIQLGYRNVNQGAAGGNRLAQIASFRRTNGSYGRTADAILNYMV